ncbi:hypothetical protein [Paenibacillus durus]|uniref:Uncharacterized protein n=1 Tax=Paenibacillus durus TaxID=44251 RepID=A0A089IQE5_PAEDU|nr:hypothetical protein [Paenibacillus durus]AIQ11274.1 hypothetical protein PDUR_04135 [Paenibacillus durus]
MYLLALADGVIGAGMVAVNIEKLIDLKNGNGNTNPSILGIDQAMLDNMGLAIAFVNLAFLMKHGLYKAADKLANSRNIAALDDAWKAWRAGGTGEVSKTESIIDDLYNRTKNVRDQIKQKADEIRNSDAYKNLSSKNRRILEQKLRRLEKGNLAAARVNIPGIKEDHISHSQINTLNDLFADLDNFTHETNNKNFETI